MSYFFILGRDKNRRRRIKTTPLPATESPMPEHVGSFVLNVPMSHEMSPLAKILVFYVTDNGETVADSIHVPIQQCLENKVHINMYLFFNI